MLLRPLPPAQRIAAVTTRGVAPLPSRATLTTKLMTAPRRRPSCHLPFRRRLSSRVASAPAAAEVRALPSLRIAKRVQAKSLGLLLAAVD